MRSFKDITPQLIVDELCAEYRRLDAHLESPKYGLPNSWPKYLRAKNGKTELMITKYFRNVAALDKFEAFIERLDAFWVAVEYFNGDVILQRKVGKDFTQKYLNKFFISILADSFRSGLDIYSKFLGYCFDLSGKEEMGFGYKSLIEPLKDKSKSLSQSCNELYKSDEFSLLRNLRDAEKHVGLDKHTVSIKRLNRGFEIEAKRPAELDIGKLETATCVLLQKLLHLVHLTVDELQKWDLGYDSPNDMVVEETDEGSFRLPRTPSEK